MMRRLLFFVFWVLVLASTLPVPCIHAGEVEFSGIQGCFRNFFTCEMTRRDGRVYFGGKPFDVVETHVFDAWKEGDLFIVTGTVTCWVDKTSQTLFAALGIRTILGHDQVAYLEVRDQDFSILASELLGFPYKRSCPWSRFWINDK